MNDFDKIPSKVDSIEKSLDSAYRLAYKLGFLRAAEWANRDDLKYDIESPAFLADMEHDLSLEEKDNECN